MSSEPGSRLDTIPVLCSVKTADPQSGQTLMPEYRMYMVDRDDRFAGVVEVPCPDDETAKEYAERLVDRYDIELWQAGRRIERFKHSENS
jgi:predicted TIM-barrel fold metal-dependent hydrolase